MYKAQNRGFDLKNRACTTLMAVLLSLVIMGCPTGGGSDPVIPGPIIIPSTSNPVPTVTAVTIAGDIVVIKGGSDVTKQYTATVTGTNSPSQVVTWSIDGNPTGVSILNGTLTVQPTASTGSSITIRATSTVAGYTDKYGTKSVMINDATDPTVTDVTVTGAPSVTKSGSDVTETYNAAVTGANNPLQVVTWSIDGSPTGVSISAGGVLTVESTASTGSITIRATSTVAGYTNISGTKSVMINPSLPPPPPSYTDFKTEANANLLGLYPGDDYANGAAVISAMDDRAEEALKTYPGPSIFYNPISTISNPIWTSPYGSLTKFGPILGNAPGMRWIVDDDDLVYYGDDNVGATITFNVAVIRISDGKGWIYGPDTDYATGTPLTNVVKETYNTPDVRTISISDLTDNAVSNVTGLGDGSTTGYKVYIIVRMTNDGILAEDYNTSDGMRNVITVHPEPSY